MARKPKLGDVRYIANRYSRDFSVDQFHGGKWHWFITDTTAQGAKYERDRLKIALIPIIREAREGGVNDAIEAVTQMPSYRISSAIVGNVVKTIREKTGVK